jgi:hypothetical protein
MSRFFLAALIGMTIAATASTSASAYHCLARSPNGASGAAFGVLLVRAQNIAMRRCIFAGGNLNGAFCHIAYCRPY